MNCYDRLCARRYRCRCNIGGTDGKEQNGESSLRIGVLHSELPLSSLAFL